MNPILAQWLPVIVMLFAIWFRLLCNNKRLDDFKDMLRMNDEKLRVEIRGSEDRLKLEILKSHSELQNEMRAGFAQIHQVIEWLDRRLEHLERPTVVR